MDTSVSSRSEQSAVVAGLLTLLLRKNHARMRYALWLVASIKFLIPFSLLVLIGSHLASCQVSLCLCGSAVVQPCSSSGPALASHDRGHTRTSPANSGREREALRRVDQSIKISRRVRLIVSPSALEAGIVGIFRPILLLPEESPIASLIPSSTPSLPTNSVTLVAAITVCGEEKRILASPLLWTRTGSNNFRERRFWIASGNDRQFGNNLKTHEIICRARSLLLFSEQTCGMYA